MRARLVTTRKRLAYASSRLEPAHPAPPGISTDVLAISLAVSLASGLSYVF